MSKFTRYDRVETFVSKAAEIYQGEWLDSLPTPVKKAPVHKHRQQLLDLLRQPGAYLYSRNPWAHREMDPNLDIYVKGKWFITNSAGLKAEVPWQTAKVWLKSGILFRNAHGFALREGRPVFNVVKSEEE